MYPVSNAFLNAVKANTRKYYWTGRITTTAGMVYEFDQDDMVKGSGYITSQCCGSTEIELGTVYAAEMDLAVVNYVPFDSDTIGNPALDVGDILSFTGGQADATKYACITSNSIKIGGRQNIKSIEFATTEANHAQFFGQVIVDVTAQPVTRSVTASGDVVIPSVNVDGVPVDPEEEPVVIGSTEDQNTGNVETICALSKLSNAKQHIEVTVDMDELDLTSAEAKATYKEIQDWVQEKYGFHVTNLNIAQVKQKHGIIERENYNKPKSPDSKQPGCPEEKVKAIEDAMRHFQMI